MKEIKDKDKKITVGCPYCTKDIPYDAGECPWCGTSFGSQTMKLLKSFVAEAVPEAFETQRKEDRVPKKLRIIYSSAKELVNSYLYNLGLGGLFIHTNYLCKPGTRFDLKIALPNGEKEVDVQCEVTWVRKQEVQTDKEKLPPGIGVKFLNLSPAKKKVLEKFLRQFTS